MSEKSVKNIEISNSNSKEIFTPPKEHSNIILNSINSFLSQLELCESNTDKSRIIEELIIFIEKNKSFIESLEAKQEINQIFRIILNNLNINVK